MKRTFGSWIHARKSWESAEAKRYDGGLSFSMSERKINKNSSCFSRQVESSLSPTLAVAHRVNPFYHKGGPLTSEKEAFPMTKSNVKDQGFTIPEVMDIYDLLTMVYQENFPVIDLMVDEITTGLTSAPDAALLIDRNHLRRKMVVIMNFLDKSSRELQAAAAVLKAKLDAVQELQSLPAHGK